MKLTTLLLPLTLLPATLADGPSIVAALTTVNETTTKLGAAVTDWRGTILGTVPILAESTALLIQVKQGTDTAEASAPLDVPASLAVATATGALVDSVNATLAALVEAKGMFDRLLLSPLIAVNLGLQRRATAEMSAAVIGKVPAELREVAEGLVAPIDESFGVAVEAYRLL
ncbi:hydrophobic surface binding protein A-domain-containing protein [Chaetomium fimeti]|uniref:Hydrophobic surface binding protein A-domain-containing protein n=1 Tax=Chaetomium fimeti TaxID=1854472 RepID=A0AAE0HD95_9PEZI|nr:hydrophobic surface binding protein A-domain-containing protein [Chaetomium fimeti]